MVRKQSTVGSRQYAVGKRKIKVANCLLSSVFCLLFLTACSSEKEITEQVSPIEKTGQKEVSEVEEISPGEPAKEADEAGMRKFSLASRTAEGKKEWEITGDKAVFLPDDRIKLDNVRAETSRNENTLVMTSKQGFFDRKNKDVRLEGDVKGVFVQKKNITTVTCDGPLEIDNLKKKATFEENVVVCSEEGKIFADKIEIFFNEEDKRVIKIVATGSVRIEKEGNKSYSEKAVYFVEQEKIVLTGSPRVEIISTDVTDIKH
ncbi:MAG: LPS export ABC transporter periplasmic protein LptC [Candidatus Omnitrophica bacterium]|nr:LPS export ABC transporter periplasmic protein LptC [Candidatus Omnitrophota bacterium]